MQTIRISIALCLGMIATQVSAQTVQLPTFSFTTVNTTVSVPDGGAAFLGGTNSASSGRSEFGLPGLALPGLQNRSIGQDRGASNMWVTAKIHDFDAMDQALLNSASSITATSAPRQLPGTFLNDPAAFAARSIQRQPINLAGNWKADAAGKPPVSDPTVEQADRAARKVARVEEADDYFARGQQAEADGKPSVAKIYYQMAARRASGDLKQQVLVRLDAVSGRSSTLVQSSR